MNDITISLYTFKRNNPIKIVDKNRGNYIYGRKDNFRRYSNKESRQR